MSGCVGGEINANDESVTYNEIKDITGNSIHVGDMILYPELYKSEKQSYSIPILKRGIVVFVNLIQNKAWFFEENNFNGFPYIISGEVSSKCTYVMCRIRSDSDELGEEIKNVIKE